MKLRNFLLLAPLLWSTAWADDDFPDSALIRTALVVSDLQASRDFYTYVLGYEIGFDGDVTRPSVIEQLRLDEKQTVHFVVLHGAQEVKGRTRSGAMIGLLHIANPTLPTMHRPEDRTIVTGEGILAIVSSDIALVFERAKELGATILLPPTKSADGSQSEMVLYDPDRIRIYVVEAHGEP